MEKNCEIKAKVDVTNTTESEHYVFVGASPDSTTLPAGAGNGVQVNVSAHEIECKTGEQETWDGVFVYPNPDRTGNPCATLTFKCLKCES